MGACSHYIAIKGCDVHTAAAVLGLRPSGAHVDLPERGYVGAQLPAGYALIVFNGSHQERLFAGGTIKKRFLRELSSTYEVLSCFVEEHVMFSTTACWKNGELLWSVTHESEKGLSHLDMHGPVPQLLEPIRRTLFAKQTEEGENAEVDFIFDVPVGLAQALTGYRYDQDIPGRPSPAFEVLEAPKQTGSFFGRIFAWKSQR